LGRFLRKDDIRDLRAKVEGALGLGDPLLPSGCRVEGFPAKGGEVFAVNGALALFVGENGTIFPLLVYVLRFDSLLPHITVDLKAVPHICNGADVFRPGIRSIDPQVKSNKEVIIVDERNLKPICIGMSLTDAGAMQQTTQGKVIRNLHYVGDSIWILSRSLEKLPGWKP
jgi:PUA domain protein